MYHYYSSKPYHKDDVCKEAFIMQFFNKLRCNLFIFAFNDKVVMNAGT